MSRQLDILALEPFYGGPRRAMLETLTRYSRHRWNILKLPPRRIERRLTAAAQWFAEVLTKPVANACDILFTSEAINLADLLRLVPPLNAKPCVVYFHANQMPRAGLTNAATDLVNLNSAQAATEIWFNSIYHLRTFLTLASAFIASYPELAARNPMERMANQSQLVYPPLDTALLNEIHSERQPQRQKRLIFVDTRDADLKLLNASLATLQRRGQPFSLVVVGAATGLDGSFARRTIPETDDHSLMAAMFEADTYVSTRMDAPADHHAMRALAAGAWPIVPEVAVYPEIIPQSMRSRCLFNGSSDSLMGKLLDHWMLEYPPGHEQEFSRQLRMYEAISACRVIDERLEELAAQGTR